MTGSEQSIHAEFVENIETLLMIDFELFNKDIVGLLAPKLPEGIVLDPRVEITRTDSYSISLAKALRFRVANNLNTGKYDRRNI